MSYLSHALMENRNGLVVDAETTLATGTAERDAALTMAKRSMTKAGSTLGADKGYDAAEFVKELRQLKITPHVAQKNTVPSMPARGARRRPLRRRRGDGGLRRHLPADRRARDSVRLPRDRRPGLPPRRLRPAHAARDRDRGQRRERLPRGRARLRPRPRDQGLGVGDGGRPDGDGDRHGRRDPPAGRPGERRPAARARPAPVVARQVHLHPHGLVDRIVRARRRRRGAARRRASRRLPDRLSALDLPRSRPRCDRDRGSDHRRARARRHPSRRCLRRERADDLALVRGGGGLRPRAAGSRRA